MKVNSPRTASVIAATFLFSAFFAICVLPGTVGAEIATLTLSPRFYSSGYSALKPAWPGAEPLNLSPIARFGGPLVPGSVQFESASYSVGEGGVTATIFVTRTLGSDGSIAASFATSDGTAIAGEDYQATSGALLWINGDDLPKGFTISITSDDLLEGNETLNIVLSNPIGGAVIGGPSSSILTINDDDAAASTISINDVSRSEGNAANTMAFLVTLSAPSNQPVSVNYATSDGSAISPSDFTAFPTQALIFSPGETSKEIAVNINGDTVVEADESFLVNLSDPTNSAIADSQGIGTLTNDDAAGTSTIQLSSLTYAVNEDAGTATITVTRTLDNPAAVSVNYATSNGSATAGQDYTSTAGTLNWGDGDGTAKNFTIPISNDLSQESNETVNITLNNPSGGAVIGSQGSAVLTILDNDSQPSISINDVLQPEGNNPNQMLFDVTLSTTFGGTVTVNYATANGTASAGSDYTSIISGTLTFNPGETLKQIAVNINGDSAVEADETLLVNLTNAANASIFDSQGSGTLLNDDVAGVIRLESANFSVSEGTANAVITVIRTGGLASGITVQYFTIDGVARSGEDYSRVSGTLVFGAGETIKTFNVPIIDDAIFEGNETLNIALDTPTGGATFGKPINAFLTIIDNDVAPTLSINDVSQNESDTGQSSFVFTVTLNGQSANPVTVNYLTADGTAAAPGDYTAVANGELTFNPGETTKQFQVAVNGDYSRETNETFFADLSFPVNATLADGQGVATIMNDDLGGAFRFNSSTYTVGEPNQTLVVSVQRTGGTASAVTVNYATSNGSAIAGQDYTAVSGTLTFDGGQAVKTISIPIANDGIAEGDETFSLILSDATGGGTLGVPNTAVATITDQGVAPPGATLFDYDGDDKADLAVYRPSNNNLYYLRSTNGIFEGVPFGQAGDLQTPADYDGDGKTDVAIFRPSTGQWLILNSETGSLATFNWGAVGDRPAPADQDGDGKADLVVFRESNGTWYRRFANNTFSQVGFGVAGDKTVTGDFDGDGKFDIAVYRASNHNWYIQKTGLGFFVQSWGEDGDIPVPADYDGDGRTDIAVFRPLTGQWFRVLSTAGFNVVTWGLASDKLAPADYDGDGKADVGVFRQSNATWYIVGTTSGFISRVFGDNGDVPTQGAFIQ